MRWRGVNHVEFSVINYDESIKFYDRMFGWLGYASLWTLDVGHRSTYYPKHVPRSRIVSLGSSPPWVTNRLTIGLAPGHPSCCALGTQPTRGGPVLPEFLLKE